MLAGSEDVRLSTKQSVLERTLDVFRQFDLNKDGSIDRCELRLVLQMLDPKQWNDNRVDLLWEAIDANDDGRVKFDELLHWLFGTFLLDGVDQPRFQKFFSLDSQALVAVVVRTPQGEAVYGPEEFLGTMTVGRLRRKIKHDTSCEVGCLLLGDTILRDAMQLGLYARGHEMELTAVADAFAVLTDDCRQELVDLGALANFARVGSCIRIGRGVRPEQCGKGFGRGDSDTEILLTSDGRILAKEYRYWGYCENYDESDRSWTYEVAEGSFSILDPGTCFVELLWRHWATRTARDEGQDGKPSDDLLDDWEAKEVDEFERPQHLVPSSEEWPSEDGNANILYVAREWLENYRKAKGTYLDPRDDPLAGVPMLGLDEHALLRLDMDQSNASYWLHGSKPTSPFAVT